MRCRRRAPSGVQRLSCGIDSAGMLVSAPNHRVGSGTRIKVAAIVRPRVSSLNFMDFDKQRTNAELLLGLRSEGGVSFERPVEG